MSLDVSSWLQSLGLGEYAQAFASNHIDESVLPDLTDADLKELGVAALGHRKKILGAIAQGPRQPPPTAGLSAQRRQAAVLFADICGFTELCTRLDPEDVQRLCERFYALCDPAITEAGGLVDKHLGDGVMAIFGAPIAHGDDTLRALRAAQALHQVAAVLTSEFGVAFGQSVQLHIGVSLGEVVAGGLTHGGYTVLGDAVNLASRLVGQAGSNETVVSEAVVRTVGDGARFEAMGPHALKGIDLPQPLWRLQSIAPAEGMAASPLMGRDAERAALHQIIDLACRAGAGHVALLRGEPGIGKTRLVEAVRAHALAQGCVVVGAQALDFGGGRSGGLLAQWAAGLLPQRVGEVALALEGDAPLLWQAALADLVQGAMTSDGRTAWQAAGAMARRAAVHELLTHLASRSSARQPTLLVAEDLHWADADTLEGMARLAQLARTQALVLLATSRGDGDPLERGWQQALGDAPLTTFNLGPLDKEDATALARHFGPKPDGWLRECVERCGGNPLYLDQLLRHASEAGGTALPASLRSLVIARVDRLPAAEQDVLRTASVLGQRFEPQALFAVLNHTNPALSASLRTGLLRAEGHTLCFGHALIREGIYMSLLREPRARLHRAAAQWFVDRDPVLCAEHLERAGDPGAPSAYARAAAVEREALRAAAALALTDRGLALQPDTSARGTLLLVRGAAQLDMGQARAAQDTFTLALAVHESGAERCTALLGLAGARRIFDDLDGALSALDQAEAIATQADDWATLSAIQHQRGNIAFPLGQTDICLAAQTQALALADKARSPLARAMALGGLGDAEYARGRWLVAHDCFTRCVAASRESGQGRTEIANAPMAAFCRFGSLDVRAMQQEAIDAMQRARAVGLPRAEMIAIHAVILALQEMGRFDEVEPLALRAQQLVS